MKVVYTYKDQISYIYMNIDMSNYYTKVTDERKQYEFLNGA